MSRTPRPTRSSRARRRALVTVSLVATALTVGAACSAQLSIAGGLQPQGGQAQALTGEVVYITHAPMPAPWRGFPGGLHVRRVVVGVLGA